MLKTLPWRGLAPRGAGVAHTGLGRLLGGSDLGLHSFNSLQPRLSHRWLSAPGKGRPVNVDYSMRWGILIVANHFVSFVSFCDRLPGCPGFTRGDEANDLRERGPGRKTGS